MSDNSNGQLFSSEAGPQREGKEGQPVEGETVRLLKEVKEGSRESLERLFERYAARVKQIVALHMRKPVSALADCDDILQDALFRAYRNIESFTLQSTGTFYSYMVHCVRASISDAARRENAEKRGAGTVKGFGDFNLASCLFPADGPTPSAVVRGKEAEERIEEALCHLSSKDRHLIMYRCLYGMTFGEIAEKLGLGNQQTVRTALARARQRLEKKIAG